MISTLYSVNSYNACTIKITSINKGKKGNCLTWWTMSAYYLERCNYKNQGLNLRNYEKFLN